MKDKKQTEGELIEYLRIALAICGVAIDSQTAWLLKNVFEEVQKKGGKFSVDDAVTINYNVRKKYERLEVRAVPNSEESEQEIDTTESKIR